MKQQISLIQFLKNVWQWANGLFNGEAKTTQKAEIRFGKQGGLYQKYSEELTAYGIMLKIGHLASMVLSFFFVYAILETPAKFMGANVLVWCSTIAITILLAYEWLKNIASKRAADGLVAGWYDYTQIKPFHLIIAAALCFGSYKMCREGSEDLLASITDKTDVITDDGKAEKDAITAKYDGQIEATTKLLKSELSEIKADKKKYVDGHSWKGHIDTRNKDIVANIATYDKRIADKEAEIKEAKTNNKAEKDTAISEIKTETGAKLTENKGITAMYAKYGFYASIVLELLILLGHLAFSSIMAKLVVLQPTIKVDTPTPPEEDTEATAQKPIAQQPKLAPQTEEDEQHNFARSSIFRLQKQFTEGCETNDDAKADAAQKGLMRWKGLGYDINTGEYSGIVEMRQNEASSYNTTGVTTVVSEKITPEKELIIIRDSAILSKYPDVLKVLKQGLSLQETADTCEVSKSIVQQVRREAKYHGLIE